MALLVHWQTDSQGVTTHIVELDVAFSTALSPIHISHLSVKSVQDPKGAEGGPRRPPAERGSGQ